VKDDVWFPVDFELKLDMRIVFKNIRRNVEMNWSEYRPVDKIRTPKISSGNVVTD